MPEELCPFCGEQPKYLILSGGEDILVRISNPALVDCHILIIPRRHVAVSELPPILYQRMFDLAMYWRGKLKERCSERWDAMAGCDLLMTDRPFLKLNRESVPEHAHIQLRPRSKFDSLYQGSQIHERQMFRDLSVEECLNLQGFLIAR